MIGMESRIQYLRGNISENDTNTEKSAFTIYMPLKSLKVRASCYVAYLMQWLSFF